MTTYYVATLGRYVLVDAKDEADARELGRLALVELNPSMPFNIRIIRPATADEIEFCRWHAEMVANEPR